MPHKRQIYQRLAMSHSSTKYTNKKDGSPAPFFFLLHVHSAYFHNEASAYQLLLQNHHPHVTVHTCNSKLKEHHLQGPTLHNHE